MTLNQKIQFGLLIIAVFALSISAYQTWYLASDYRLSNRPYLSFKGTDFRHTFDFDEKAILKGEWRNSSFKLRTTLINSGKIPARFEVGKKEHLGYEGVRWDNFTPEGGVIGPGQEISLGWLLEWDSTSPSFSVWLAERLMSGNLFPSDIWSLRITVNYSTLDNSGKYYSVLESDVRRSPSGEIGVGGFVWKVVDAK